MMRLMTWRALSISPYTAAVTASFVSGTVVAAAFVVLAGPLLHLMHVPAEVGDNLLLGTT
jgi:hypothetical protein